MGGKIYRGFCNFLFFLKAMTAIVLGSVALGAQGYLVYVKYHPGKISKALKAIQFIELNSYFVSRLATHIKPSN